MLKPEIIAVGQDEYPGSNQGRHGFYHGIRYVLKKLRYEVIGINPDPAETYDKVLDLLENFEDKP